MLSGSVFCCRDEVARSKSPLEQHGERLLPRGQGRDAGGWCKGREGGGKVPTTCCDSTQCRQGLAEPGVCRQLWPVPGFSSSMGVT